MANPNELPPDSSWPRFQFSLRTQLIAVTLVALILGLLVLGGARIGWLLFYGVVYCLAPTPLAIIALFGRGEVRTFSVGALVPWAMSMGQSTPTWAILYSTTNPSELQIIAWMAVSAIFMLVAGAACGGLAVATRRWLERRDSV